MYRFTSKSEHAPFTVIPVEKFSYRYIYNNTEKITFKTYLNYLILVFFAEFNVNRILHLIVTFVLLLQLDEGFFHELNMSQVTTTGLHHYKHFYVLVTYFGSLNIFIIYEIFKT